MCGRLQSSSRVCSSLFQSALKASIDPVSNTISVWNDGRGVPVVVHKEHHIYVPELIFGHLLTSSNYDDDERKGEL